MWYGKQIKAISLLEIREIDLVDHLAYLGFTPSKIKNIDYWYLSPLRDENTASFKVNRKLNRWYDHGLGQRGNVIDFAILFYLCTVGELLRNVNDYFSFHRPTASTLELPSLPESKVEILTVKELSSVSLERYLINRRIPLDIAKRFCKEVTYRVIDKEYFAIGFKNNSGGYELRNPYCKISSSPKDVTTLTCDTKQLSVFEGFLDFLSFIAIQKEMHAEVNFPVLN